MEVPGQPITASRRSQRQAWMRLLPQVGLACVVVVWLVGLFQWLEGIPQAPESFEEFGHVLARGIFVTAGIATVGGFWIAGAAPATPARRGSRAAYCVIAALVCWWLPLPFGLSRFVSFLLYALAAAAAVAIAVASGSRRPERRVTPRVGCIAVVSAGAAASALLLSIRLNSLGWTFAID